MPGIKGCHPKDGKIRIAVDHVTDIFKKQAKRVETVTDTQRVIRQWAQAQRVQSEEVGADLEGQWMPPDELELGDDDLQTTNPLEVEYPPHSLTRAY